MLNSRLRQACSWLQLYINTGSRQQKLRAEKKLLTNYGFKELRLHTIYLMVFGSNPRAKRAYEKCGFVECGRRHEALFVDGKYIDLVYMELINK